MSNLNIVGIQFRKAGKIYDFGYHDMELKVGNHVVVNTEKESAMDRSFGFNMSKNLV